MYPSRTSAHRLLSLVYVQHSRSTFPRTRAPAVVLTTCGQTIGHGTVCDNLNTIKDVRFLVNLVQRTGSRIPSKVGTKSKRYALLILDAKPLLEDADRSRHRAPRRAAGRDALTGICLRTPCTLQTSVRSRHILQADWCEPGKPCHKIHLMARTAGRALRSCTRLVKGPGYSERYGLQPKQSPVLLR